jgi:hypothetical protein
MEARKPWKQIIIAHLSLKGYMTRPLDAMKFFCIFFDSGSIPDNERVFSSPKRPYWFWGPHSLLTTRYWRALSQRV